MSTEIDELKSKIIEFYNKCKESGQGMWLIDGIDSDSPWLALTGLGHGLKAMGYDIKARFQGRKLLEIVNETGAFDVATAGLPVYIRPSDEATGPRTFNAEGMQFSRLATGRQPRPRIEAEMADGADRPADDRQRQPENQHRQMKPYKLRAAYRAILAGNADAVFDDEFINVSPLMEAIGCENEDIESFTSRWRNDLYVKWEHTPEGYTCIVKPKNMAYLRLTDDVAFYPYDRYKNYWSALEPLKQLALPENWGDKNQVLDNYLRYTYSNIVARGELVKSADDKYAVWNTGLVNMVYQPIYCFLERVDDNTQWLFRAFCIEGQNEGKELVARIPRTELPQRINYFGDESIFFRPDDEMMSIDYEHMVAEHPSRLPEEWLRRHLPAEDPRRRYNETDDDVDSRLGAVIAANPETYSSLLTELEKAVKVALLRCRWNYRTPIPFYDPRHLRNGWFLPLTTEFSATPFGALVVTKLPSGTYQGETIYRTDWAYPCARLMGTLNCDWLQQPRPARTPAGAQRYGNSYAPHSAGYDRQGGNGYVQKTYYKASPAGQYGNYASNHYGNYTNRHAAAPRPGYQQRQAPIFIHGQKLYGRLNAAGITDRTERKVLLDDGRWIWIDNNNGFMPGLAYENIPAGATIELTVKVSANRAGAPLYLATNIHEVSPDMVATGGAEPGAYAADPADNYSSYDAAYDADVDTDDDDDANELHNIAPLSPSTRNDARKSSNDDFGGYLSGLNF